VAHRGDQCFQHRPPGLRVLSGRRTTSSWAIRRLVRDLTWTFSSACDRARAGRPAMSSRTSTSTPTGGARPPRCPQRSSPGAHAGAPAERGAGRGHAVLATAPRSSWNTWSCAIRSWARLRRRARRAAGGRFACRHPLIDNVPVLIARKGDHAADDAPSRRSTGPRSPRRTCTTPAR